MLRTLLRTSPALVVFIVMMLLVILAEVLGVVDWWSQCRQDYLRYLPHGAGWAKVRLRISEAPYTSEILGVLSGSGAAIVAELKSFEGVCSDGEVEVAGKVRLIGDWELRERLGELKEGDILQCTGTFLLPEGENSAGFDYRRYLESVGIFRLFSVEDFVVEESEGVSWLTRLRLRLAEGLVVGMEGHVEEARLAVTLGLGRKEFLPRDDKQMLAQAGVIHAFAISGLHVGMVAAMLLFVLQWLGVSLKWRWLFASVGVVGYVTLTGFTPSAVRAMFMALLMFYAWARQRPASSLHAMGLVGIFAILLNPRVIHNLGFVYSYLVVFALVFAWPGLSLAGELLDERSAWIPLSLRSKWHSVRRLRRSVASVFLVSLLAWLTCAGVSLNNGTRICLASPLLNIPVAGIVPVALLLCLLKMGMALVCPPAALLLAPLLVFVLSVLRSLASLAAESSFVLATEPFNACMTAVYYAAWLLLEIALRKWADAPPWLALR